MSSRKHNRFEVQSFCSSHPFFNNTKCSHLLSNDCALCYIQYCTIYRIILWSFLVRFLESTHRATIIEWKRHVNFYWLLLYLVLYVFKLQLLCWSIVERDTFPLLIVWWYWMLRCWRQEVTHWSWCWLQTNIRKWYTSFIFVFMLRMYMYMCTLLQGVLLP